jgi:predicted anti-sigma-YlaC factor YlaD
MQHQSTDDLALHVLEALSGGEQLAVERHLEKCATARMKLMNNGKNWRLWLIRSMAQNYRQAVPNDECSERPMQRTAEFR